MSSVYKQTNDTEYWPLKVLLVITSGSRT